jgi:hypothetical protein
MPRQSELPFLRSKARALGIPTISEHDLTTLDSWGRILSVYDAPSLTSHAERLFTFGFVVSRRPERVLEIGFRFGGNSFLILCALEDAGRGKLVALDPNPEPVLDFSRFGDRFELIRGRSPDDVPRAISALGGPVDFCFLDGDHEYSAALADLEAIDQHTAHDAYILIHDAAYPDVQRATDTFLATRTGRVIDCGLVCPVIRSDGWSGLRLLRVLEGRY